MFSLSPDAGSPEATGLSPYGLAIMVVSVAGILILVVSCYATLLRTGRDQEER